MSQRFFHFVRQGGTCFNKKGLFQHVRARLNSKGKGNINNGANTLWQRMGAKPNLVVSPIRRGKESGKILGNKFGLKPSFSDNLLPMDFGVWQAGRFNNMGSLPEDTSLMMYNSGEANGGETLDDVQNRMSSLLNQNMGDDPDHDQDQDQDHDQDTIFVTHDSTIRATFADLFDVDPHDMHVSTGDVVSISKSDVNDLVNGGSSTIYFPKELYPTKWTPPFDSVFDVMRVDLDGYRCNLSLSPLDHRNFRLIGTVWDLENPTRFYNIPQHEWPLGVIGGFTNLTIDTLSNAGFHVQYQYPGNSTHSEVNGNMIIGRGYGGSIGTGDDSFTNDVLAPNVPVVNFVLRASSKTEIDGVPMKGEKPGETFYLKNIKRGYTTKDLTKIRNYFIELFHP